MYYDYALQFIKTMFILSSKLSFDACINDNVSDANRILGFIKGAMKLTDEVTLVQIYKAFVRLHLEFSNCM